MRTRHFFLTLMFLSVMSVAMAEPATLRKLPKEFSGTPLVLVDTFSSYLVLQYDGLHIVMLDMRDSTLKNLERPAEFSKLKYMKYVSADNGILKISVSDGKKTHKILSYDKSLNVTNAETAEINTNNNATPQKNESRIYSSNKQWSTMTYYGTKWPKDGLMDCHYKVALYKGEEKDTINLYSLQWKDSVYKKEKSELRNIVQFASEVSDKGELLNVSSWRKVLIKSNAGGLKKEDTEARSNCDIKILIMKPQGKPEIIEFNNIDSKYYLTPVSILSYEGDKLLLGGLYCNLDETNTCMGFNAKDWQYTYQGAFALMLDLNTKQVISYKKQPAKRVTNGVIMYPYHVWQSAADPSPVWYKYNDGYKYAGLGSPRMIDVFVDNEGNVKVPRLAYQQSITFDDEEWIDFGKQTEQFCIDMGHDEANNSRYFLVKDYADKYSNGIYFKIMFKDSYFFQHVHPALSAAMRPQLCLPGTFPVVMEDYYTNFGYKILDKKKVLVFGISKLRSGSYYFYDIVTAPDVKALTTEEIDEISEDNVQNKIEKVSLNTKSLLNKVLKQETEE